MQCGGNLVRMTCGSPDRQKTEASKVHVCMKGTDGAKHSSGV